MSKDRKRNQILSVLLILSMILSNFNGISLTTKAAGETDPVQNQASATTAIVSKTWDFESEEQAEDFTFYHSEDSSFSVKDGMLVSSGKGELKAISNEDVSGVRFVSVDIIPGESGLIDVGLYVGASNVGNASDQIDAIAFLVESFFTGWEDAANRIDIVTGEFPIWKEYKRVISETGAKNELFKKGEKQPLRLRLDFEDDLITVTLSLVSNAKKYVQTLYQCDKEDLQGKFGIRAVQSDVTFDNFQIGYDRVVPNKLQQGLKFEGGGMPVAKLESAIEKIPQTLEMWVKVDRATEAGRVALFSSFSGTTVATSKIGDFALFTDGDGQLWWFEKTSAGHVSKAAGSSIKTGEWVHVAIARTEGNVKYYVNGQQQASVDSEKIVLDTASTTIPTLGYCYYGSTNYLDGIIGDVRLWSVTRTAAEIQEDMFTEASGTENGLMHCWTLDEQQGTEFADKTNSGNDGSIKVEVGATWSEDGLQFHGGTSAVATLSKPIASIPKSIEMWVKVDPAMPAPVALFSSFDGTAIPAASSKEHIGEFSLMLNKNGKLHWFQKTEGKRITNEEGEDLRTGQWVHVAFTRDLDNKLVKYYINGNLIISKSSNNVGQDTGSAVIPTIGYNNYTGKNLQGAIKEIRLWNVVRTDEEISGNMNKTLTGTETGLMNYWPLDEDSGTTFADKTSSGNNGTITIDTTSIPKVTWSEGSAGTPTVPGQLYENKGYCFSQDVWISSKAQDIEPNHTIEAWVKMPKAVKSAGVIAESDRVVRWSLSVTKAGSPSFYWKDEDDNETEIVVDSIALNTGKWTHLAFVSDANAQTVTCYLNGVAVSVTEGVTLNDITTQKFFVGDTFLGLIGDLRIWNKALTEGEVKNSMSQAYTEPIEGLVVNIPFDEVNATEFRDLSGNENTIIVSEDIYEWHDEVQEPGDFSIVAIPDQQVLSSRYPEKLYKIYQWIADNAEKENIKFVTNLGDITDYNSQIEWERSLEALDIIDDIVPYSFVPGNHEYFIPGSYKYTGYGWRNLEEMNKYFGNIYDNLSTYGGAYDEGVENTWHEFEVYGHSYLIFALELNPRDSVLEWASDVIEAHPNHQVIVTTHSYMQKDGTLFADGLSYPDTKHKFLYEEGKEDPNDGKRLWEKFLSQHENIIIAMCGHIDGHDLVYRIDKGVHGNDVLQMLIDAQTLDGKQMGVGVLAILRFSADGENLEVSYFSPGHGSRGEDEYFNDNILNFTLPPAVISEVDKSEIEAIVETANKVTYDAEYPAAEWTAFEAVLKNAKAVLADDDATHKEVEDAIAALEKAMEDLKDGISADKYTFDSLQDALEFDFYHSSTGGFVIKNGKITPSGEGGEFKAILKGDNRAYQQVSVDIYPGEDGNINAGLYLHAADAGHGQDKIHGLTVLVESNLTGWEDAPNRVDIIVGSFPQWKELSRTISETGNQNALFINGQKEPLNLKVDIKGKILTITASLLSNPDIYVETVYEYMGEGDLSQGKVGVRSMYATSSFDNFEVTYKTTAFSQGEANSTTDDSTMNSGSPNTGDNVGATMELMAATMVLSFMTLLFIVDKKRKSKTS